MGTTDRTVVTVDDVNLTRQQLAALSRQSDRWRYDPGGSRWIDSKSGDVIRQATPEGVPDGYNYLPPDETPPEGHDVVESPQGATYVSPEPVDESDDEGGESGTDDVVDEQFERVPDAGPSELAGGVAAAIDDARDDFHDIRNAVTGADSPEAARKVLADNLSPGELATATKAVAEQQRMRETFDVVDDITTLEFGQRVLADGDRPITGYVDDVEADGTVWINYDDRDMVSGHGVDTFEIYADPEGGEEQATSIDVSDVEGGRFGLASSDEVLENAFDVAEAVVGSREAGIDGGNTTGEDMKVLELPDGSRAFATPAQAYDHTSTGVVSGREEAIDHNRDGPKVIDAFGGHAAKTSITEFNGDDYIVKEGIDGDLINDVRTERPNDLSDGEAESLADTMAAGYFAGNKDLHGANRMIGDDGEAYIIDHDSQTTRTDPVSITIQWNGPEDVEGRINDLAREYAEGEIDLGDVGDTTERVVSAQAEGLFRENGDEIFSDFESAPGNPLPDGSVEEGDEITYIDDGKMKTGVVEGSDDFYLYIDGTEAKNMVTKLDALGERISDGGDGE